jgi:hypothetical protein
MMLLQRSNAADSLVMKLIIKYKDGQKEMKIGKKFDEAYHLDSIEPTLEWQGIYEEIITELEELGPAL